MSSNSPLFAYLQIKLDNGCVYATYTLWSKSTSTQLGIIVFSPIKPKYWGYFWIVLISYFCSIVLVSINPLDILDKFFPFSRYKSISNSSKFSEENGGKYTTLTISVS